MIKSVNCGVCNKPVDQCTYTYNRESDVYMFLARCHGAFDRCAVPAYLFSDGWKITEATAFRPKSGPGKEADNEHSNHHTDLNSFTRLLPHNPSTKQDELSFGYPEEEPSYSDKSMVA